MGPETEIHDDDGGDGDDAINMYNIYIYKIRNGSSYKWGKDELFKILF